MKSSKVLVALILTVAPGIAMAAAPLSADQLLRAAGNAVQDYSRAEPDMSKSITGIRSITTGNNALVTLEMNADGMRMSAKYLCVAQGQEMACRLQQ